MEKLKILQIAPKFPFPIDDGGKISIANILKEFALQGCEVTFFVYNNEKLDESAIDEAKRYSNLIICKHSTKNTMFRIAKAVFKSKSLIMDKHISKKVIKKLDEVIAGCEFDIIHCDHSYMAPLGLHVKKITGKPVGLRLHNLEWRIWSRYAEHLPAYHPKRLFVERQARLLKAEETELMSRVDVCFTITDIEKKMALAMSPNSNLVVAGAGVQADEWTPYDGSLKRNPYEMIHATTYRWVHNVDAIKWFIHDVLPKVRAKFPSAVLTLIGKDAPDWLYDYKDKGVNVIGYVEKVQPYLNMASVYVAPLFVGGGIRIKILEAMAMQLPVVASTVSAEGIKAGETDGLVIADSAQEFAEKIEYFFRNKDKVRMAGAAARKYILKEHSWSKNVAIMLTEYDNILRKNRSSGLGY